MRLAEGGEIYSFCDLIFYFMQSTGLIRIVGGKLTGGLK